MKPSNVCLPAACLVVIGTTGCSGLISSKGGDAIKSAYAARVASLWEIYGTPAALNRQISEAEESAAARNILLSNFIFLIDTNYDQWEKALYNKKAYADFGSDVSATTLSTISGAVGATGAKTVLSLIAGGITSTKTSFNSDILQSQNLLAVITKMRASRAQQLLVLQSGMYKGSGDMTPKSLEQYSVEQGLVDLAAYYEAGTFVNALQDIIDKAGKDKSDSDKQSNHIKGVISPAQE